MRALYVLSACVTASVVLGGCAMPIFGSSKPTRERAIANCTERVPADAVPYADAFSACMEEQGWTYSGTVGPRQ